MMYANYEDYGDLCADNDISRLYTKTKFLKNALIEYSFCLDMSWQVIWAYIQPGSFEYLVLRKYEDMEKMCTGENVHSQLNCTIAQGSEQAGKIKRLLTEFENDSLIKHSIEIRDIKAPILVAGEVKDLEEAAKEYCDYNVLC